jgi:hypothetical protein
VAEDIPRGNTTLVPPIHGKTIVTIETDKLYTFSLQQAVDLEPLLEPLFRNMERRSPHNENNCQAAVTKESLPYLTQGDTQAPVVLVCLPPDAAPFISDVLNTPPTVLYHAYQTWLVFDAGHASLFLNTYRLGDVHNTLGRLLETGRLTLIVRAAETVSVIRLTERRLGPVSDLRAKLQAAHRTLFEERDRREYRPGTPHTYDPKEDIGRLNEALKGYSVEEAIAWLKNHQIELSRQLFEASKKESSLEDQLCSDHAPKVQRPSWTPFVCTPIPA